jgi:hypothetical protein
MFLAVLHDSGWFWDDSGEMMGGSVVLGGFGLVLGVLVALGCFFIFSHGSGMFWVVLEWFYSVSEWFFVILGGSFWDVLDGSGSFGGGVGWHISEMVLG